MQEQIRASLRRAALIELGRGDEDDPAGPVGDFGFHHNPQAVLSCWFALRNWHVLPVAGGWLDQPEAWRADLLTCQAIYNDEFDATMNTDEGPTMDDLLAQDGPKLPVFGV